VLNVRVDVVMRDEKEGGKEAERRKVLEKE
jgi:hypothetical protein